MDEDFFPKRNKTHSTPIDSSEEAEWFQNRQEVLRYQILSGMGYACNINNRHLHEEVCEETKAWEQHLERKLYPERFNDSRKDNLQPD